MLPWATASQEKADVVHDPRAKASAMTPKGVPPPADEGAERARFTKLSIDLGQCSQLEPAGGAAGRSCLTCLKATFRPCA